MDTKWTPAMPSAKRLLPRAALILASCMAAEGLAQDIDPQALTAFLQGVECLETHEVDAAVDWLNKAIRLQPDYAEAYYKRGNCYRKKMLLKRAIEDYDRAIQADPDFAKAYCNRGSTYAWLGRAEDAKADYDRAIELDSLYALPHILRGWQQLEETRGKTGRKELRRGIQLALLDVLRNLRNSTALFEAGTGYAKLGEHERAIQCFTDAIHSDPRHTESYVSRARSYAKTGRKDDARADLAAACRIRPRNAMTCCSCAFVYDRLHDWQSAHAEYSEAIRLSPEAADLIYLYRAASYRKAGWNASEHNQQIQYLELALADYVNALRVNPACESTQFHAFLGVEWNDDTSGMIVKAIDQAIELSPTCADARMARIAASCLLRRDPLPEANKYVAAAPDSARSHLVRGLVYLYTGEYQKAVADFTESIRIDPDSHEAYRGRSKAYEKMGRIKEAKADSVRAKAL